MRKKKHLTYGTEGNVVRIDCDIICGDVIIAGYESTAFTVERAPHSRLKLSECDGVIKIRQTGKPLFHRASVKICVPAFCVPDISIKSGQGRINITGGTYGDLQLRAEDADVILCRASFVNTELKCKRLKLYGKDISVKRSLDGTADEGETLMENSVCAKFDLKYKNGFMGISELKCPDTVLSIERGSLNVILKGSDEDYTLNLMSKYGTCNRESVYGGANAFKAYSEYGNIVVDFTEKKEVVYYGNDDVAEDTCVARGA